MDGHEKDALAMKKGLNPFGKKYREMYKDKPVAQAAKAEPVPDIEEQRTLGGPRGSDRGEIGKKWNELFGGK